MFTETDQLYENMRAASNNHRSREACLRSTCSMIKYFRSRSGQTEIGLGHFSALQKLKTYRVQRLSVSRDDE